MYKVYVKNNFLYVDGKENYDPRSAALSEIRRDQKIQDQFHFYDRRGYLFTLKFSEILMEDGNPYADAETFEDWATTATSGFKTSSGGSGDCCIPNGVDKEWAVFVHPEKGDDSSAELGNIEKPYQTITEAQKDLNAGWIVLMGAEYTEVVNTGQYTTYIGMDNVFFSSGGFVAQDDCIVWIEHITFKGDAYPIKGSPVNTEVYIDNCRGEFLTNCFFDLNPCYGCKLHIKNSYSFSRGLGGAYGNVFRGAENHLIFENSHFTSPYAIVEYRYFEFEDHESLLSIDIIGSTLEITSGGNYGNPGGTYKSIFLNNAHHTFDEIIVKSTDSKLINNNANGYLHYDYKYTQDGLKTYNFYNTIVDTELFVYGFNMIYNFDQSNITIKQGKVILQRGSVLGALNSVISRSIWNRSNGQSDEMFDIQVGNSIDFINSVLIDNNSTATAVVSKVGDGSNVRFINSFIDNSSSSNTDFISGSGNYLFQQSVLKGNSGIAETLTELEYYNNESSSVDTNISNTDLSFSENRNLNLAGYTQFVTEIKQIKQSASVAPPVDEGNYDRKGFGNDAATIVDCVRNGDGVLLYSLRANGDQYIHDVNGNTTKIYTDVNGIYFKPQDGNEIKLNTTVDARFGTDLSFGTVNTGNPDFDNYMVNLHDVVEVLQQTILDKGIGKDV